jgi:hypothetical protein
MRYPALLCAAILLTSTTVSADPPPDRGVPIPDSRVAEAKALLEDAKIGTRYIGATDAVLAVWRVGTDEPVRAINVRNGASTDPAFTVRVQRGGGIGTIYGITEPPGYVQLAFRMNVHDHTKRPWFKGVTTVSVPDELLSDDRMKGGIRHLSDTTDTAQAKLDERNVRSNVPRHTREPVGTLVSKLTLMALPIVERVASEIADGVDAELAIRRALTGFAVNGEDAFDYAKSPVGARGAYQFMRGTYLGMRLECRRARLDPQFIRGARDHVNAAMAERCLADHILAQLTRRQLQRFLDAGDEETGAYIAAAYNGGDVYALRSLNGPFGAWDTYRRGRGLVKCTVQYVKVFRTVYRFLQQNTPG